jgi:hypothetical protein
MDGTEEILPYVHLKNWLITHKSPLNKHVSIQRGPCGWLDKWDLVILESYAQVEEGKIYLSISIGIRVSDPIEMDRLRLLSPGVILLVNSNWKVPHDL